MSGRMALYIASLLPYFALLWALNTLLFNRTLYITYFNLTTNRKLIVPYIALGLSVLSIIFP